MKHFMPTMNKGLRKQIHKKYDTITINECNTSKKCCDCNKIERKLLPTTLPVKLSAPPDENVTVWLELAGAADELAATLADDPTPRLGVVMQLVVVTP